MEALGVVAAGIIGALDGVLDFAEDTAVGGGAVLGRVVGRWCGLGETARQGDAAADGSAGAVECGGDGGKGGWRWGRRGVRGRSLLRGLGLGNGLLVQEVG